MQQSDIGGLEWPGNSPDLNACETLGAHLKTTVETKLRSGGGSLRDVIEETLREMEFDTPLFERLLRSYPSRLQAVQRAHGGHTDY